MGRPPLPKNSKKGVTFQMRAAPSFLATIDRWCQQQRDRPSRAEGIRRLVELGLKANKTRTAMKAESMQQHVIDLCASQGIVINWIDRPNRAAAVKSFAEIWIAPVKSPISYAVALHEIGHVLGRNQNSRRSLTRERWAWEWARANASQWLPSMEERRSEAIRRRVEIGLKAPKPRADSGHVA